MCAITGIFRFKGRIIPEDSEALGKMINAQVHRGPDDEGVFREERVLLGHRRLSILDTSACGHQPFSNREGTIQIVYNGEIYNFRELRSELEGSGRRFVSKTDTEVLLQGYEMWGIDVLLKRLRGMFAFAIFDHSPAHSGQKLILARDRFGIKPLYYFVDDEKIVFASEVGALKVGGLVPQELESRSLTHFLQLGSVPAPSTTLKGIRSLPPGTVLISGESPSEPAPYWDLMDALTVPPEAMTYEEAISRARQLLQKTVEQHLISDVPLGLFLSGGIDSSALVALAKAYQTRPLVTLSVTFEESAYDESGYARRVAGHYGTEHHEVPIGYKSFKADLPAIFAAMDQPTVDGVNTYMVSKAARGIGLRAVLSGLGADELFSGYRHLQRARAVDFWVRVAGIVPKSARRFLRQTVGPVAPLLCPRISRKWWCLEDVSRATPWWLSRGLFSPTQIAQLTGAGEEDVRRSSYRAGPESVLEPCSPEERMRYLEYSLYLQNQLLKDSDAMSMAHSIELRVPFLDHELVQGILRLPSGSARRPWVPKRLLVEATGSDFPKEIWQRPKRGFTFPMAEWLMKDGAELEAMALERTPLRAQAVREVWSAFRAGRQHWSRPWMTVVAARFYGR